MNYSDGTNTNKTAVDTIITAVAIVAGDFVVNLCNVPADQKVVVVAAISTGLGMVIHAVKHLFDKGQK